MGSSAPIVIAGGGTAGHVLPGLSIAQALMARGYEPSDFVWIGSGRGQEVTLVPPSGIPLIKLPGRGIQRKLSVQSVRAVFALLQAVVRGILLIRKHRPAAVLTLGGYASVAASIGAIIWRVPLIVAEQNASAGAANRLAGRFAKACAIPMRGTDLPNAVLTGNPVRDQIIAVSGPNRDKRAAREQLGLPTDAIVLSAFAGSLGSRRINQAIAGLAELWVNRSEVAIHHVVGARDWDLFEQPDVADKPIHYQAVRYEQRMDLVLAASDIAVSRSGGTTVAELGVVGVGSVLVPLPIAPRDHQRVNAAELVEVGGALLVDDTDCTAQNLDSILSPLIDDRDALEAMGAAALSVGRPNAAEDVADLIEKYRK